MLTNELLSSKWQAGLEYGAYVATGTAEQQRRWNNVHAASSLTAAQRDLLAAFVRPMKLLTISGVWCGDCIEQVPFLDHIAAGSQGKITHRIVDRDQHKDLSSLVKLCAGDRVPVVVLMSEDFDFCALAGDRSLARYRAKAQRELGAACSTGLFVPAAEELAATLQDWLNEVERVQLMLRLSPRYRKKYGD
jgi:hypothetical protein